MPDSFQEAVEKRILAVGKPPKNATVADDTEAMKLIMGFEKFSPKPYSDRQQISIGYGTKAMEGETEITEPEARRRMRERAMQDQRTIMEFAKEKGYNWTPEQIDALTSFRFNIGSIGELTANGTRSDAEILAAMPLYVKGRNEKTKEMENIPGLVTRREKEAALFRKGMERKKGVEVRMGE